MKRYLLFILSLYSLPIHADAPVSGDRVSYGAVFLKNNTQWDLKITADLKDEWDNITPTEWLVPSQGTEKMANLFFLGNMRFTPEVDDESKVAEWLRKTYPIRITSRPQEKDLIIYINKSRFGNRWDIKQRFVTAAKIEYGGPTGYELKILIR